MPWNDTASRAPLVAWIVAALILAACVQQPDAAPPADAGASCFDPATRRTSCPAGEACDLRTVGDRIEGTCRTACDPDANTGCAAGQHCAPDPRAPGGGLPSALHLRRVLWVRVRVRRGDGAVQLRGRRRVRGLLGARGQRVRTRRTLRVPLRA